jgi:4-hydroxy-tetrahydrodipicolinate synthase
MAIFKGAGVAIVTPFKEDLSVNYDKLDELIDFHCDNGTDAIIICGTTGESATLSEAEHAECIKFTIERTKNRLPVIAGTGSNATGTAIELSKGAEIAGADGLLIVTPYYNKATQAGLVAHYKAIANEVKTPIIMYSVASRTGVNIEADTVATLVKDVPNIVGVKEASGNISQVAKIMQLTDGNIDLYSGNDDQILPLLALGGIGVISVLSNVAPKETHDICELFFKGEYKASRDLQLKAIPLIDALFSEVNPIPVKTAVNLMGQECGGVRMPLTELTPVNTAILIEAMKEFGIKVKLLDAVKNLGNKMR